MCVLKNRAQKYVKNYYKYSIGSFKIILLANKPLKFLDANAKNIFLIKYFTAKFLNNTFV